MKTSLLLISTIVLFNSVFGQGPHFSNDIISVETPELEYGKKTVSNKELGNNGYQFSKFEPGTNVNSKYSDLGSGIFRDKIIIVSSRKIGGLAKKDKNTNEGYKTLFCADINYDGSVLEQPLLFSRILNTKNANESLVSFSPDEHTIYFTRSAKNNSKIYQLYKATLERGSHGNWINQELLSINKEGFSIESPQVSPDGKKLYFSSNMPGTIGGYDLFVAFIKEDGTLEAPKNLGKAINTPFNENYPSLSKDGRALFFASQGHINIGGYDVFKSNIRNNNYESPVNLGNTVNTQADDIALFFTSEGEGYISSNKMSDKGGFNITKFDYAVINQNLNGTVLDQITQIPLPNTEVILYDIENKEIQRTTTKADGSYSFVVLPNENYIIKTQKEGFVKSRFNFIADNGNLKTFNKDLIVKSTEAVIEKRKDKFIISVENIYFDYDKAYIKRESYISLNKVLSVLKADKHMKIQINAHTDSQGNDDYNLTLSEKRAKAAKYYLVEHGVNANRLIAKGYGETQPLINCGDKCSEDDYQSNRRIEFIILD